MRGQGGDAAIRFGLESYKLCAYLVACAAIDVCPFEHPGCGQDVGSPRPATISALPDAPFAILPVLRCSHQAAPFNRVGGGVAPPPLTPPDMRVRIRRFVRPLD